MGFSCLMMMWFAIIGITMALSLWAAWRVKSVYLKYSKMSSSSGITGAEAAAQILRGAGINDVEICEHDGMLSDHYDPINRRLVLSSKNFQGTSPAALGVSAHECGHALQHQMAYAPLKWRMAAIGAVTFANQGISFLWIFGIVTGLLATYTGVLLMAICWGIIMLFNLITLPVEFDASRRAKRILGDMNFIRGREETVAVNKVLDAAAWTYVAAFITSLLYFLMYLLPLLLGGRRSD